VVISPEWIAEIKSSLPELPNAKRIRFAEDYEIQADDIERLIEEQDRSDFFEACVNSAPTLEPKIIANWMLTDLFAWINQSGGTLEELRINPPDFTSLIILVEKGSITQTTGKEVLIEMLENGKSAKKIVEDKGLQQVSDVDLINEIVEKILTNNPNEVQAYHEGKTSIANWLFGQVMRDAKGKANPQIVRKSLLEKLQTNKNGQPN
jgi:aspartyl-tRNA(Asn)/glutamyl-tRNA(Gln) amidotransferase subunit B